MATYTTLAIVDDVNTCDCCGKPNLKSTVAMERDDGEVMYFGSVCATRHSGRDSKALKNEAAAVETAKNKAAVMEYRASPEYAAERAKLAEATRIGITPGKPFREFCRAACDAATAKSHEVAAKHGVRYLCA